jgi:hypothetical protein
MYCSRCGITLAGQGTYCPKCGGKTIAPAATANLPAATHQTNRRWTAKRWIPIAAIIAGVILIALFQLHQAERQRRFDQIDAQIAAASRLKAQQEQEAFNSMTPVQHLAAAKDALRVDASSDQVSDGMKHLATLQGTALESQGELLRKRYEAEEQKIQRAQAVSAAASAAVEKKHDAEAKEVIRQAYAKTFENNMLGQGMNVDVNAIGPLHTTLRVRWVLATKVDAYQITTTNQELLKELRDLGFKKFVVWNGYDSSWTWTLDQ